MTSTAEILHAATEHLQHRLTQLVQRGRIVEPHRDPLTAPLRQKRVQERGQHFRRVVPAADAVFVVADANEARIFERLEPAERNVGRNLVGFWILADR